MPFGPEGFVIPWYVPVPSKAKISITTADALEPVSKAIGPMNPRLARDKHGVDVFPSDVFNVSISWDIDQLRRWDEHNGGPASDEAIEAFAKYMSNGEFAILHALVEHPPVPVELSNVSSACSTGSQRGDIYYTRGKQDLFLQVQFHNAYSDTDFVNLAPTSVVHMSFATNKIWYPLALTRFNEQPTSVLLNLMTDGLVKASQLPTPFQTEKTDVLRQGMQKYIITQVTATLEGGKVMEDLEVSL